MSSAKSVKRNAQRPSELERPKRPGKRSWMTTQRETFARLIALEGYNASDAYREAYNSKAQPHSVHVSASQLLAEPEMRLRVDSLRQRQVDRSIVTREGHLRRLAELGDMAAAAGQFGPAVTAENLRGKVEGFYVERSVTATSTLADLVAGTSNEGGGHEKAPAVNRGSRAKRNR